MLEETHLDHEPWLEVRLDQLQTLARLERRAEGLRAELATLQELLICHVQQTGPWAAELHGTETILIVDDQVVVRAITQDLLEGFGYRVLVTADTRLKSYATDLVLLDVPIWDDRVSARLRQVRERFVPLVVSTPLPEGVARQKMRDAGVAAFLSKPFHSLELARCIRSVLDHSLPRSSTKRL